MAKEETKGYDYKITLKKAGIAFAVGGVPTLIAFLVKLPPEVVGGALGITIINTIGQAVNNWLKNKDK